MSHQNVRYRCSPHVVSYWEDGRLVFHNYATQTAVTASPLATQVLHFFHRWRPGKELVSEMTGYTRSSLKKVLEVLVGHSLLQRSDHPSHTAERAMESWTTWNPAAGFLHFSTKDIPYETDEARADRFLKWRAKTTPIPPPVKRYPKAASRPLPAPNSNGDFSRVLFARRTWRSFGRRPLDMQSLATLLGVTFGVQHWVDEGDGLGRVALKTSPSGGARHPIEAYLVARRVSGLAAGLYHYAPDSHRLTLLRRGATSRTFKAYLPGQRWYGAASALVIMTAVMARVEWKYPYPRSYRALLLEAGHFSQTFCLVATSLALAPFCTDALADSRIEQDLGIDGINESVIFVTGVGTRPTGVKSPPL